MVMPYFIELFKYFFSTFAVMYIGCMNRQTNNQPHGIRYYMPFPAFYLFVAIDTPFMPTHCTHPYTCTVNNTNTCTLIFTLPFTNSFTDCLMGYFNHPFECPFPKIPIHRLPRGIINGN